MTLAPIDHATDAATRPEQAPASQTPALADHAGRSTPDMLRGLLCRVPPGRIALASWSAERLKEYVAEHGLPRHPLQAQSYRSLGCAPCMRPAAPGADPRAGRWAGRNKTECGTRLPRAPVPAPRTPAPLTAP